MSIFDIGNTIHEKHTKFDISKRQFSVLLSLILNPFHLVFSEPVSLLHFLYCIGFEYRSLGIWFPCWDTGRKTIVSVLFDWFMWKFHRQFEEAIEKCFRSIFIHQNTIANAATRYALYKNILHLPISSDCISCTYLFAVQTQLKPFGLYSFIYNVDKPSQPKARDRVKQRKADRRTEKRSKSNELICCVCMWM